jgi:hypothetical protein
VTAIWARTGQASEWELLTGQGFPDEAALRELVEETPQLLPLAGIHTNFGRQERML